ncbi:hypothetical protein BDB00DRAFT_878179 [Zychaea mexicana]|uniref:uncharacterized protein n=1 Tax=Zychaea mexicana TaxID=64656 RepID=UPI0022FDED30|nr:uncharacterized protein BDB00DRAFT_878179 [Zychaea mexicana]KAI9484978.1 hypothetical protein BDB00DRAFT_878179 [Zychaea mexicana]
MVNNHSESYGTYVNLVREIMLVLVTEEKDPVKGPTGFALYRHLIFYTLDHTSKFRNVRLVTPTIAMLMYWCRLTVLTAKKYEMYLQDGKPTAFNALHEVMWIATTAAGDEPRLPRILWIPDSNYRKLDVANTSDKISIDHLRICIELCMEEMKNMMNSPDSSFGLGNIEDNILGLCKGDTHNIGDNMGFADVGYSYISDPRNRFANMHHTLVLTLLKQTLWQRIYVDTIDATGTISWKKPALYAWLERCIQLQRLLIVAIHLSYGQPC